MTSSAAPSSTTARIERRAPAGPPIAAQAIEDGAALAALLKAMPGDVPGALARYEALRKPRATRLQEASAANRTRFHLPDGPEQRKRDEAMAT